MDSMVIKDSAIGRHSEPETRRTDGPGPVRKGSIAHPPAPMHRCDRRPANHLRTGHLRTGNFRTGHLRAIHARSRCSRGRGRGRGWPCGTGRVWRGSGGRGVGPPDPAPKSRTLDFGGSRYRQPATRRRAGGRYPARGGCRRPSGWSNRGGFRHRPDRPSPGRHDGERASRRWRGGCRHGAVVRGPGRFRRCVRPRRDASGAGPRPAAVGPRPARPRCAVGDGGGDPQRRPGRRGGRGGDRRPDPHPAPGAGCCRDRRARLAGPASRWPVAQCRAHPLAGGGQPQPAGAVRRARPGAGVLAAGVGALPGWAAARLDGGVGS